MRRFYILILSVSMLPHCVAPPEYSDGLLENIPAIVDASDYFSLSILGDQYTADHESVTYTQLTLPTKCSV